MKNANVVVFENDAGMRKLVNVWLTRAGHSITHEASTMPEALLAVDQIASGTIACDVVMLDGTLGLIESESRSNDAERIMSKIHQRHIGVKVVGFSDSEPLSEDGIEVDADADKDNIGGLPAIIAKL